MVHLFGYGGYMNVGVVIRITSQGIYILIDHTTTTAIDRVNNKRFKAHISEAIEDIQSSFNINDHFALLPPSRSHFKRHHPLSSKIVVVIELYTPELPIGQGDHIK